MKKRIVFILLAFCLVPVCLTVRFIVKNVGETDELVVQNDKAEITNTRIKCRNKVEITKEDGYRELEYISRLLHDAYIGTDEMIEKGFSKENLTEAFDNRFRDRTEISVFDYERFLNDYFSDYVNDSHFSISDDNERIYHPTKEFRLFYSNIYVRKQGSLKQGYGYKVYESDVPGIMTGDDYSDSEEKLFYYPIKGRNIYRVCIYSDELKENIKKRINVNNKFHIIDFTRNFETEGEYPYASFEKIESDSSIYLSIPTFSSKKTSVKGKTMQGLKYIQEAGELCKNKEYVIIDLRGNSGGEVVHFSKFLSGFMKNDRDFAEDQTIRTLSSPIQFEEGLKNIKSSSYINGNLKMKIKYNLYLLGYKIKYHGRRVIEEFPAAPNLDSDFNGMFIILTDKYTASAAEVAIVYSRQLFGYRCIKIGENTNGCFKYSGVLKYKLPYTGIYLSLCSSENKYEGIDVKEGYGFNPDYCSTKEDILETLETVVQDKEIIEKIKETSKNLSL